jgi:hypothetical protein
MSRRNPPTLVDPTDVVTRATDRQLGITPSRSIEERLATLERLLARQDREVARALRQTPAGALLAGLAYATPGLPKVQAAKGSVTADSVTSTTGTTIVNGNTDKALVAGVPYLVIGVAAMAANAPSGQSIISQVRIEASGSNTEGMRTTTVGGERTLVAVDIKTVVGTGSTINIAGRARVTGGTGSINDAVVFGVCVPLNVMTPV